MFKWKKTLITDIAENGTNPRISVIFLQPQINTKSVIQTTNTEHIAADNNDMSTKTSKSSAIAVKESCCNSCSRSVNGIYKL